MPKLTWDGDGLTAEDIDEAEDGYQSYAGDIPPGGVYRFKVRRMKFKESSKGTQGISILMHLDGSWKPAHRKYDGCPLWDDVWMTKGSAAFVKALANALGVPGSALISGIVIDDEDVITKIGKLRIKEGMELYVAVKRGEYDDTPRLEKAGTGFQVVETEDEDEEEDEEEPPAKPTKRAAAKAAPAKSSKRPEPEDDEEEEDEEPARPAKKSANTSRASSKSKSRRGEDDEPPF